MSEAYSIGIIGGADGPTAVLVAGSFPWELLLLGIVGVCVILAFIRRKK